jgi:hypothetical protein
MPSDPMKTNSPYEPKRPPAPQRPVPAADPRRDGPYNAGVVRSKPEPHSGQNK